MVRYASSLSWDFLAYPLGTESRLSLTGPIISNEKDAHAILAEVLWTASLAVTVIADEPERSAVLMKKLLYSKPRIVEYEIFPMTS